MDVATSYLGEVPAIKQIVRGNKYGKFRKAILYDIPVLRKEGRCSS